MGDVGVQISICPFVCTYTYAHLAFTLAATINEVYKPYNCTVNFTSLMTVLNKDDNLHSSGACFHILVRKCDIKFNEVLSVFS